MRPEKATPDYLRAQYMAAQDAVILDVQNKISLLESLYNRASQKNLSATPAPFAQKLAARYLDLYIFKGAGSDASAILKVLTVARGVKTHLLGNKTVRLSNNKEMGKGLRGLSNMRGMLVLLNMSYFTFQGRRGLYNRAFRHVLIHESVHASTEERIKDKNIGTGNGAYGKTGAIKNVRTGTAFENVENYVYAFGLGEHQ